MKREYENSLTKNLYKITLLKIIGLLTKNNFGFEYVFKKVDKKILN